MFGSASLDLWRDNNFKETGSSSIINILASEILGKILGATLSFMYGKQNRRCHENEALTFFFKFCDILH